MINLIKQYYNLVRFHKHYPYAKHGVIEKNFAVQIRAKRFIALFYEWTSILLDAYILFKIIILAFSSQNNNQNFNNQETQNQWFLCSTFKYF